MRKERTITQNTAHATKRQTLNFRLRSPQIMALEKSLRRAVRFSPDQTTLLTERRKNSKRGGGLHADFFTPISGAAASTVAFPVLFQRIPGFAPLF